jgi:flagellar basal body-associated protein FliL
MILLQIVVPAFLVFFLFIFGHFFINSKGSGIYMPETNYVSEEKVVEIDPDVNPLDIDPETGQILPDKYNYLKIENVFSGKLVGSEKLFSIEVALVTKQPTISSDLFISALYEMENDLIAEITKVILEVTAEQLSETDGRQKLSLAIQDHLNDYLESEDMFAGITGVFITNFNIV